jgi:hypothetical protein
VRSCAACGAEVAGDAIGVRDVCASCRAYLHSCRHCDFYAPGASRDCREPNAELVADKEGGNFCDYFRWDAARPPAAKSSSASAARAELEALFRKGREKR